MGKGKEENKMNWRERIKRSMKRLVGKHGEVSSDEPTASSTANPDTVDILSNPPGQTEPIVGPPLELEQDNLISSKMGLWKEAANDLGEADQKRLEVVFNSKQEGRDGHGRDSLADNVNATLARAEKLKEEHKDATWKPVLDKIISGALEFKSLGDAAVSFDQSGYAALGWSVVSFGLQMAANAQRAREFVLSSSEVITHLLARYGEYERTYRGPDAGENFDRLLTNVYKAILLYVIALKEYLDPQGLGRVQRVVLNPENQLITSTKKAIDTADDQVIPWIGIIKQKRIDSYFERLHEDLNLRTPAPLEECLKSLSFREMYHRLNDIEHAAEGTCKWLHGHEKYKKWADDYHGLLCIKGKPGSGKSTLLKHALDDAILSNARQAPLLQHNEVLAGNCRNSLAQVEPEVLILSFFFHDRGSRLQKTPLGLFRSLLHQLLRCVPGATPGALLSTFKDHKTNMGEPNEKWDWSLSELQKFFQSALQKVLESHQVLLFIDALDEYGEEDANKLIKSFNSWFQASPSQTRFHICFTCRHHPLLDLPTAIVEICLEDENKDDISTYIQTQLSTWSKNEDLATIGTDIADRASGVFMWARLMVPRVLKLERKGQNSKRIRRELQNTPQALDEMYRELVEKAAAEPHSFNLVKWICFSIEPLTLDELRWAMVVDPTYSEQPASLTDYENGEDFATDYDMMEKRLNALSCGLAEVMPSSRVVQFIHQSVKDFFIKEGLSALQQRQDPAMRKTNDIDLGAIAHSQLSKTCIRYFSAKEIMQSNLDSDELEDQFPFLRYARDHWIAHIQQSEKKVTQTDILRYFAWPSEDIVLLWTNLPNGTNKDTSIFRWRVSNTMLHVASRFRLMGPLKEILQNKELLGTRIDAEDDEAASPLYWAARMGHEDVVRLLLENGADPDVQYGWKGHALYAASGAGDVRVIRTLLDHGADINAVCGTSGSALELAAVKGDYETAKMLLDNGADVDIQGGNMGTALQMASSHGDEQFVQLLFDKGADVNAEGGLEGTALEAASFQGHEKIVEMLIEKGADVNAGEHGKPLKMASEQGHEQIVQILLKHGAVREEPSLSSPGSTDGSMEMLCTEP